MEPMEANVQTQPGKRLAEEPKRKKGGKGWKAAIGIIAAAAVVFYGACCVLAHTSDTYFPHTQINGVDVSGKTQSDAASAIQSALRGRTIDLTLESESEPFTTVFMSDLLAEQWTLAASPLFTTSSTAAFSPAAGNICGIWFPAAARSFPINGMKPA